MPPGSTPLPVCRPVTWILICAVLNYRKKKKAKSRRLIPRKAYSKTRAFDCQQLLSFCCHAESCIELKAGQVVDATLQGHAQRSTSTFVLTLIVFVFLFLANVAAAAGGVLYGLTYMPYIFLESSYDQLSRTAKGAASLLPNVAMGIGCQIIGQFEGQGKAKGFYWRRFLPCCFYLWCVEVPDQGSICSLIEPYRRDIKGVS